MNLEERRQNRRLRWWHKLIGRDDKFYDLLEAAAVEAATSVGLLRAYVDALRQGQRSPDLNGFAESRRRQKKLRTETVEELYKALVPPFDRDDIQALAFALYRIPKVVEKLAERLAIYPGRVPHEAFARQTELLTVAVDALVFIVRQLLAGADPTSVNEANARLQSAEGDADKMMLQLIEDLYRGPYSAKELIILQSLFEIAERAIDRCRNAGAIVVRMMLKSA